MEVRPFSHITPSIISALEKCFLQAAFRADRTIKTFQPPPVRLGTACHALLERVAKGELANQSEEEWLNGLEAIWKDEITKQEAALLVSEQEKHFGRAESWPKYAIQKARVFLKAKKLLSYQRNRSLQTQRDAHLGVEHFYTAFEGRLRGRADVVYESEQGVELIDYKTGNIFDEDEDGERKVKERYRQQLHLYAAMHHDCTGVWPVRGHLVPLTGAPFTIEIDQVETQQLVQSALERMRQFNALVSQKAPIDALANPSFDACQTCNYKAYCPAFWACSHDSSAWGTSAHLEAIVLDLKETRQGDYVVSLQVTAGTLPDGRFILYADRLGDLAVGRRVRLVNVRTQEENASLILKISDYTTIYLQPE